jgi:NADH-quinone oxidoreductase subunit N
LAGFWGKLALLASALSLDGVEPDMRVWFVVLAVFAAVNTAISAAYYLRIIGLMFFRSPIGTAPLKENACGPYLAAGICVLAILAIGVYPGPWIRNANLASPQLPTRGAMAPVPLDGQWSHATPAATNATMD